jgi:acyl-CoA reductase-like NAD-dependent aldehyde dehydrogenase
MSTVQQAALYEERVDHTTSTAEVDQALAELSQGKSRFRGTSIAEKVQLVQACLEGTYAQSRPWVEAACRAKGIDPQGPLAAEEISGGPMAVLRYCHLLIRSLKDIQRFGTPQLPGEVSDGPGGRLKVQVMPTRGMFDSLLFQGFKAHVWMQPGVTRENLRDNMASSYRRGCQDEGICLVLGAGNVSSIAPADVFSRLFHEGKVCLLKMNPVNEYLGPIFQQAFAPLIEAGYLRIVYGGAEVGNYACQHERIDEVHITGSVLSHETIVWGPPGPERDRRKAENDPVLKKEITSELGNVSPWIIVPGPYSEKQLRFQAENLVASVANNASFNCVATKVIVTHRDWPQRDQFLQLVTELLQKLPRRKAYYPGACQRYEKFAEDQAPEDENANLPWTLRREVDPDAGGIYFDEESFVCVFAETALEADSPEEYLSRAVDFANHRLRGTLGATLVVHPSFRARGEGARRFEQALADLEYGTVAVNHWSALSYGMMSPPWGGYPGASLQDPLSGIGWVHNTYMLDAAQKTVLDGPLTVSPKPFWFPTNQAAHLVGWRMIEMLHKPSIWKLPQLFLVALKG